MRRPARAPRLPAPASPTTTTGAELRPEFNPESSPASGAESGAESSAESGAASVMVLSLIGVVLSLTVGALVIASVLIASQRARLAADLGSLAGASAVQDGASPSGACAAARQVAVANGAAAQSCSSDGSVVDLSVAVSSALWPDPAVARARAGPESVATQ
ncbi:Rv3654c family TadE-like protein [Terrabacter sp. C0L_2]|uniref:Rv3654c family TadE-like protein n=1 Tax=Terrabacter sp. C0L_2 TaxID=3108389 RepID=UPI002ED54812|nr:Rv3654c family TadE-like protein [Terrabacter sp. C0L_2]